MVYVKVSKLADVPVGTTKVVVIGNQEIAICNADGQICAVDNICSHDESPLEQGELIGFEIECPRHGAKFDVRTGEATEAPATLPIDTFPVQVDGDDIQVDV